MIDLRLEMGRAGIPCESEIICDGQIHRFKVDRSRKANGWYIFFRLGQEIFGAFGDWKTGARSTIGVKSVEIKEVLQKRKFDIDESAAKAAKRASDEWARAEMIATTDHPYLTRKRVGVFGARAYGGSLLIPMSRGGSLVGLQAIRSDGTKRFTSGCKKAGAEPALTG